MGFVPVIRGDARRFRPRAATLVKREGRPCGERRARLWRRGGEDGAIEKLDQRCGEREVSMHGARQLAGERGLSGQRSGDAPLPPANPLSSRVVNRKTL